MATLPSTVDKPVPAIGFISHVDTPRIAAVKM
jgi:tripeptide aminopeptidase